MDQCVYVRAQGWVYVRQSPQHKLEEDRDLCQSWRQRLGRALLLSQAGSSTLGKESFPGDQCSWVVVVRHPKRSQVPTTHASFCHSAMRDYCS
ncbi:hypothetical protein RRG08_048763 [Elysia crispata]|uniref:Uncharacterized protein n=1 Tax=Elysia crispata TaxID=231223 RepID=A0AAE1E1L8_9GAST|nr:hypothetical protein RRG08_048763 [Elysia crispata]